VALVEAGLSLIIMAKRPDFMTKLIFSINIFTVVNFVTECDSILQFPLSGYYFDSRGLHSVPKHDRFTGNETATYHVLSRAGR